jgi:hypothetical protein
MASSITGINSVPSRAKSLGGRIEIGDDQSFSNRRDLPTNEIRRRKRIARPKVARRYASSVPEK